MAGLALTTLLIVTEVREHLFHSVIIGLSGLNLLAKHLECRGAFGVKLGD